jgi:hypothetical protein
MLNLFQHNAPLRLVVLKQVQDDERMGLIVPKQVRDDEGTGLACCGQPCNSVGELNGLENAA